MTELEQKTEITTEKAIRYCINENAGKVNIVRVELHGIARFACWWFVIWSIVGGVLALPLILASH